MDLETSFMGFFIAFEAKIYDFWSNIGTFYHLTTSSDHTWLWAVPSQAREYVESLHQNQFDNLLYGKNNVHVLPKEGSNPVPGYLSLHQSTPAGFRPIHLNF